MLAQNSEYMPNKQPYLANQLHTIATEMEQTEVGRASGQTFHTSSGQFNTDVLTKALRDSGWKLFKQWYPDSEKDLDVEIQPLFDLDMQYNSLELVACDPPSEDCIRSNGVLGYLLCNVDKEDSITAVVRTSCSFSTTDGAGICKRY